MKPFFTLEEKQVYPPPPKNGIDAESLQLLITLQRENLWLTHLWVFDWKQGLCSLKARALRGRTWRVLALRGVDLDEVLQFGGVAGEWAAVVGLHVRVDAAVTEDKAGGGEHCGVRASPVAQRTVPVVWGGFVIAAWGRAPVAGLLLQVERGRGSGQGGQGFHGALVVGWVPPLQELQEKDAQRERGGQGHGHAPRCLWHQPPRSLHQAANTRAVHCG